MGSRPTRTPTRASRPACKPTWGQRRRSGLMDLSRRCPTFFSRPEPAPMDREAEEFLNQLLLTPSPTGDEHRVQRLLNDRLAPYADRVDVDVHGNLYLAMNPEAERSVMLAAHCDQIGFLITEVGTNGFLYFEPLGGLDGGVVQGGRVT